MFVARTLMTALLVIPSVCLGQVQPIKLVGAESAAKSRPIAGDFEALEQATEVKLRQPIEDFRFEETPLDDIINQIEASFGTQVIVDRSAIDSGLGPDKPITFAASGISLDKALELLLNAHEADFVNEHGVIRIIAKDVRNEPAFLMTRVYNCGNLLKRLPELAELTATGDNAKDKSSGLRQLVMEMVTPNEWKPGAASVRQIGDLLVVSHNRRGHRSLQELLTRLETQEQGESINEF